MIFKSFIIFAAYSQLISYEEVMSVRLYEPISANSFHWSVDLRINKLVSLEKISYLFLQTTEWLRISLFFINAFSNLIS